MLKPSSVLNLAIVTQKMADYMENLRYSSCLLRKKHRKVNEGNDLILRLFYSKTTGTNPAFKDYS